MILRKAKITDVEEIHSMLNHYAKEEIILPRSRSKLYESIREFSVAEENGKVLGAGSLHIMWHDLAEIRSLAVLPSHKGRGIGKALVDVFLSEALSLHLPRVFTLTYEVSFFEKCGFRHIAKEDLPQKVWRDCIDCPRFPNCDENAMIIEIDISP